jgi:hypothetical protein
MPDEERIRQQIYAALAASAAAEETDYELARLELQVIIEAAEGRWRPISIEIVEWAA